MLADVQGLLGNPISLLTLLFYFLADVVSAALTAVGVIVIIFAYVQLLLYLALLLWFLICPACEKCWILL